MELTLPDYATLNRTKIGRPMIYKRSQKGREKMSKRNQVSYTDEFREQIAKLAISGKPIVQIVKEYGIAKSTVGTWTAKYQSTGSFRDADNRSEEENELIKLRKENKQLKMENDILKQAALILAQK